MSRTRVIPGNWEPVEALRPGASLAITTKSGVRITGAFKALHPMIVAFIDRAGKESTIPKSDVAKIVVSGAGDRLTNGALTGASVGLAAAVVSLAIIGSRDGYVLPSAKWGAPLLLSTAGGLLGAVIDHIHEGEQLLYEAGR